MINISDETKQLYRQDSVHKNLIIRFLDGSVDDITNPNIISESLELQQILCDETQIRFGLCNAAQLKVTVAEIDDSVVGKEITAILKLDDSDEEISLGIFEISSVTKANDYSKTITALDRMSKLTADVYEWYNALDFPITIKALRDGLFKYVGLEQEEITLANDNREVNKKSVTSITGTEILRPIIELEGMFGRVDEQGIFRYVSLSDDVLDITETDSNLFKSKPTYEEYTTATIDGVKVYDTEGAIYPSTTYDNAYVVDTNYVLNGKSADELDEIIANLYNKIKDIRYVPYSSVVIKGQPYMQIGDKVTFIANGESRDSYILSRTLSGVQGLTDTYKASGLEKLAYSGMSTASQLESLSGQVSNVKVLIEKTGNEIRTEVSENYTTKEDFNSLETQVNTDVANLQSQIDGNIQTWNGTDEPTLNNYPANEWTDKQKATHTGDLYYDANNYCYRFQYNNTTQSYEWSLLKDSDITKAIKDASDALQGVADVQGLLVTDYSTTTQMNTAIKESAESIETEASKTYATQTALQTVDGKFANYSTTSEMNSAITQSASKIEQSVSETYATQETVTNLQVGTTNKINRSMLLKTVTAYETLRDESDNLLTDQNGEQIYMYIA